MTNKTIPIGEVKIDEERRIIEVDRVIEETPNGQFIDPQKRTYLDARANENGAVESSGLFLRKRTDAEKQKDLENILCRDPTFCSVVRDTTILKLPYALARYAFIQFGEFVLDPVFHTIDSIDMAIRKRRLEGELDKQNIPHGKGEDFDNEEWMFRHDTLGYVWEVAERVANEHGVNSKLFDKVTSQLLTKREKKLVVKNALSGEHPRWGIATVEDRRYKHKEVTKLYRTAVALAEKYGLESELGEWYKSKVEASPFYSASKEERK